MVLLGFDTATPATAVALWKDDGATIELRDDPPAGAHPGHATRLLGMAAELLGRAEVAWGELDRIAVGLGPGTFTGLRVGVATARGLAQSLGVELVGISSLQALALPALAPVPPLADSEGAAKVLAMLDARRGELYLAAYERSATAATASSGERPNGGIAPPGELPHGDTAPAGPLHAAIAPPGELMPASTLTPAELTDTLGQLGLHEGAGRGDWLAVGDGAIRAREQLAAHGLAVAPEGSPLHRVTAGAICALGAAPRPLRDYREIEPDYGRRPDAELALEALER